MPKNATVKIQLRYDTSEYNAHFRYAGGTMAREGRKWSLYAVGKGPRYRQ